MKKLFFVILIFIASFLRLWQLGEVPASPDWDEVALGYNAYSIMQTGKDEYGQVLPIVLRSFDDYKPALYAYLAIPSITIFGLNTFAVRLPSAVMGVLTVIAVYFLVKELFPKLSPFSLLLFPFLLAISPWHIQFSRVAFEANVGLAFNIFAALFFLAGFKKPWFLSLSAFFASLALYTYHSEKIFTPLLFLALMIIFRKELLTIRKKHLVFAFLTGFILFLPLGSYVLSNKQVWTRAQGVSILADQTAFLQRNAQKILWDKKNNDFLGLILDNRRIQYLLVGINGYLSHFDLNWLFITEDEARHRAPGMGLLYLWELPFLLMGVYSLIFGSSFDHLGRKTKLAIFSWFLIAPLPASMTRDLPHTVRTLNFLPIFQIFTALGLIRTFIAIKLLKQRYLKLLIVFFLFSFFIFNFLYYLNQYFVQQNYFNSSNWQYGYKEAVEEVKKIEGNYDKIVVASKPPLDQSYIFFLFYLRYNPALYQKDGGTLSGRFAKFVFRPIEWSKEIKSPKTLYVGRPGDFPEGVKLVKTVNFLDGTPAIKIVEGQ